MGVSSQRCSRASSRAAAFCLSLSRFVSFFPILFSLSLSQACLALSVGFSQPSANLLVFFLLPPQVSLAFPSAHPSPSMPKRRQMERNTVSTERRQETPRETHSDIPTYPVPTIAGKCVFSPWFHGGTRSEQSGSFAASGLQIIFQRLITSPNLGRFSWTQQMVYSCFRGRLLPNFKPFSLLLGECKHCRKKKLTKI